MAGGLEQPLPQIPQGSLQHLTSSRTDARICVRGLRQSGLLLRPPAKQAEKLRRSSSGSCSQSRPSCRPGQQRCAEFPIVFSDPGAVQPFVSMQLWPQVQEEASRQLAALQARLADMEPQLAREKEACREATLHLAKTQVRFSVEVRLGLRRHYCWVS